LRTRKKVSSIPVNMFRPLCLASDLNGGPVPCFTK
jgi:hypothetical protein